MPAPEVLVGWIYFRYRSMYATHKSSDIKRQEDCYTVTSVFVTHPMELPITLTYEGKDKKIVNYLAEMQSRNINYPILSLSAKMDLAFLRKLYTEEGKPVLPLNGSLRMLDGYILRFLSGKIVDNNLKEVTHGRKK